MRTKMSDDVTVKLTKAGLTFFRKAFVDTMINGSTDEMVIALRDLIMVLGHTCTCWEDYDRYIEYIDIGE